VIDAHDEKNATAAWNTKNRTPHHANQKKIRPIGPSPRRGNAARKYQRSNRTNPGRARCAGRAGGDSWGSPSLRGETAVGPNGAVTTRAALLANDKWGIGNKKHIEQVTDGVYAMRGWGIASCFAIEAPDGWIIIDTGDHTRAAAEMRAKLEETLGRKVKVAAILLTHWHYGNGIGAWLDEGAEVWGHEHLDRNLRTSTGISVLSGTYQARAAAQFGVFHPTSGPDAFPNTLGFTPDKLLAGPATNRPRGSSRTAASSMSSSPASRCRSLPTARTRPTASASISRASACS
jgi:hypothetical protein